MSKKNINPNAVYLGRAIACTRLELGMKRKELAVTAGISHSFLAEVKAVTRHKFAIKKNERWCIQVVLDV